MAWRLASCLKALQAEVNAAHPGRPKGSDGTVGDQAHAARRSSHNPDPAGVVRAWDITAAPFVDALAEHLRHLGQQGDRRVLYLIWRRRICSAPNWTWRPYSGANPHDKHMHISCSDDPHVYDGAGPWGYKDQKPKETVVPAYNPPIVMPPIVDSVQHPEGNGAVLLGQDGSFYTYPANGSVRSYRGVNGMDYWGDRKATALRATGDPKHPLEISSDRRNADGSVQKYAPEQ